MHFLYQEGLLLLPMTNNQPLVWAIVSTIYFLVNGFNWEWASKYTC